ncbi:hypothetical protein MRB53_003829 [Persea americana]|uniref:Uncharacterized protein n=1 Tax=Persea americana TaxID=3435 RepID=A0ACC2MYP1_PERAE|nr:hypothetical protein MRB53_003829 [Persea americana]
MSAYAGESETGSRGVLLLEVSHRNGDVGLLRNLEIAAAVGGDVATAVVVNGSSGPLEKERRRETNSPPSPARQDLL